MAIFDKDEILQRLCSDLNENCKYKNECEDRNSWFPNTEWDIDDLSLDIKKCRQYCYTSCEYVHCDHVALCDKCEKILHKHLDKYASIFELSHEDLCLEIFEIKQEVEKIKEMVKTKSDS